MNLQHLKNIFAYDLPEGYSLITAKDYYCDIIDNEAVNEMIMIQVKFTLLIKIT